MKKLTNILLIITSAFLFSSCGDSKDKVFDDSMDLMEEMAEAIADRDKEKFKELEKEGEELKKRAKELGIDLEDVNSLTDDQKKRRDEVVKKMAAAMKKAMSGK